MKSSVKAQFLISQTESVGPPGYFSYYYLLPGFQNPQGGTGGHTASSDHTELFTVRKASRNFRQLIHTKGRQEREARGGCD